MRGSWRPALLTLLITTVSLLIVVAFVWWQWDERPLGYTIWFGAYLLVSSKTGFKGLLLVGLGVAVLWRPVRRRLRRGQRPDRQPPGDSVI